MLLWAKQTHVALRATIEGALAKIEGALHGPPATIDVEAGSVYVIPSVGIGGTTDRYTGHVHVQMDARSPVPVRDLLTTWLPTSLAHELHHSKRILAGPGYGDTLGEAVVTEGAAEAFVHEVYPAAPKMPWLEPLPDLKRVWAMLQAKAKASDDPVLHDEWFYGRDPIPRWAGYRLGYAIVESYLASHRDVSAARLATVPARDVLRDAGSRTISSVR